ncbi:hypothetical protein RH831_08835 [Halodesulfurarchaeum sp. HSR-GB]|uniref:hypothetical protein n=1 Tax=Halodesulfurarchaeum sp. HSR-GB TaxID=3074077 RepID=UPI002855ACC9|nr:hypothetical protein [Halodesulfurarchaeum sp. HSR-GB]MDR5657284.1 hypothetical protein [Halodesulfurarchaeum sp. HSR-GB]
MFFDFLESFGVELGTWAMLFVIAWYLFRGARAGRRATSVLGRVVTYTVLILVSFGAAAALGYADLHLSTFVGDVGAVVKWGLDEGLVMVEQLIQSLF